MIRMIKNFLWVKLGISFEGSPHSVCVKCNRVIFCPRTGVELDPDSGCDATIDHKHIELQIVCTCKGNKRFWFERIMERRKII